MAVNQSKLPQGLSIVVSQTIRNYVYSVHNSDTVTGDASLHGLYSTTEETPTDEAIHTVTNKVFITPFGVAEPNATMRKSFAHNCNFIPQVLSNSGLTVLSDRVDHFYKASDKMNDRLAKSAGKRVSKDKIQALEDTVNQYATKCIELKIKCVKVTQDHIKGSHKRSDGLYTQTSTMRTVHIDRALSDEEIASLVKVLINDELIGTATAAWYQIVKNSNGSVYLQAMVDRSSKTSLFG